MRNIRKLDYIIFFVLIVLMLSIQLYKFEIKAMLIIIIFATIKSAVLGTLTNLISFIFKTNLKKMKNNLL